MRGSSAASFGIDNLRLLSELHQRRALDWQPFRLVEEAREMRKNPRPPMEDPASDVLAIGLSLYALLG